MRCIAHLCLVLLSCLFSVFTVRQNKHHRCLFSLGLQTERSLKTAAATAAAAVTVFVVQTSNYYTAPTFIQLLLRTHTYTHMLAHTVYYHLSLCDGTEQQELYTLINQPTCQCIYNN